MVIEIEGSIAAGTQPIATSVTCRSMMEGHETRISHDTNCTDSSDYASRSWNLGDYDRNLNYYRPIIKYLCIICIIFLSNGINESNHDIVCKQNSNNYKY